MDDFDIYTINSKFRVSGTSSNFSYSINLPKTLKYDHVTVLGASIPVTYYLIKSGDNTFQLKENSTTVDITITAGNYSRNAFKTVVASLLNTNSPNGWTYAISYPNDFTQTQTGKFTFSVTGNSSSQPRLIMNSDVYKQFGFTEDSTNVFSSNSLTSTNVINFMPDNVLYIHSDMIGGQQDSNVLADIYSNNAQPYTYLTYVNQNYLQNSRQLSTNDTNIFNFTIMTIDDKVIDLNGHEVSFTLLAYRKDTMSKRFKEYLKLKLSEQLQN